MITHWFSRTAQSRLNTGHLNYFIGSDPLKAQPDDTSIEADDVNSKDELLVDEGDAGSSDDEFVGSISVKQSKDVKPSNCRSRVRSGHASLQLTLVFCYLGLLWVDEPVFLSDIIRFDLST